MRSVREVGSAICSGRLGDSSHSRDPGRANCFKSACVAELVGFGTADNYSATVASAKEKTAAATLLKEQVARYGNAGPLAGACIAMETAN